MATIRGYSKQNLKRAMVLLRHASERLTDTLTTYDDQGEWTEQLAEVIKTIVQLYEIVDLLLKSHP